MLKDFLNGLLGIEFGDASRVNTLPRPPKKTDYDIGRHDKPDFDNSYYYGGLVDGARDALKAGEPANFTALFDTLKTPYRNYQTRGSIVLKVMGDLTAGQMKTALAPLPPERQKAILDDALIDASGSYDENILLKMAVLIKAGADVNAEDGMPLRAAASRGKTEIVQALYDAGAKFDTAIFGAEVGTKNSGVEVARKLALYNNKLAADEPGFKPVPVPELPVPPAVIKTVAKPIKRLSTPFFT